jgi:hypothetical protein
MVHEKVAGFNLHTFSDDMQQLTTDFIDYTGKVIHSFTTTKGQVKPPPPPPISILLYLFLQLSCEHIYRV